MALSVLGSLRAAEPHWRALENETAAYVFQTFDWVSLWCNTLGTVSRSTPFIVAITNRNDRLAGLLPLAVRQQYGCRILEFLGTVVSDYSAPLLSADSFWQFRSIDSLLDRVVELARADVVLLRQMPGLLADGSSNPLVEHRRAIHSENAYASQLPSSFDEFAAGRDKVYFSETARKRRKLARLGSVRFDVVSEPEKVATTLDLLLAQKRLKYGDHYMGPETMPAFEEFYRRLAVARIGGCSPVVACLCVDEVPVATTLGVIRNGRFYGLMSGYDVTTFAQLGPGRLLMYELVRWCIGTGVKTFDLTVGDEDYKRYWADSRMPLYEACYSVTAFGAANLLGKRALSACKNLRLRSAINLPDLGPHMAKLMRVRSSLRGTTEPTTGLSFPSAAASLPPEDPKPPGSQGVIQERIRPAAAAQPTDP